jgi:hypothetical protein
MSTERNGSDGNAAGEVRPWSMKGCRNAAEMLGKSTKQAVSRNLRARYGSHDLASGVGMA